MDLNEISNEDIGKLVKSNPMLKAYLQLGNEVKLIVDKLNKIEKTQDIHNAKLESHQHNIDELNGNINNINSKINTFEYDRTGRFELYKATARARVHQLVGEKGSLKYILFYSPFKSKIYSDIYNHFGVNNSGSIDMSDANTAIGMAKSWKPSMKYVHNKLREYQNMQSKGILKEERSLALNKFLEETNGGNDIAI